MEVARLAAGGARLDVLPAIGAGIARLDVGGLPVLRPWSDDSRADPFALGCNLLAPFSNRISSGFDHAGRRLTIEPNLPGEAMPIHGDAFQKPWRITERSGVAIRLELAGGAIGPWRYRAEVTYRLEPDSLSAGLALVSLSEDVVPFGLGFHPWFPRSGHTRLRFRADAVWPEDDRHLPATEAPEVIPAAWDFTSIRPLPQGWINNAFAGWDGRASVEQGPDALSVEIHASEPLRTALIYSPGDEAPFFCFEPVSHPVDAVNLPGRPGLQELAPGQTLSAEMQLRWIKGGG